MQGKTEHYLQLLIDPGQGERGYWGYMRLDSTFWQSGDARSHSPS